MKKNNFGGFVMSYLCFSIHFWSDVKGKKHLNVYFHSVFVCSISALGGSSALHIPAFPSGGCLIDYAPQVCQLLTSKVNILFIAQLFNSAETPVQVLITVGIFYATAYHNQPFRLD